MSNFIHGASAPSRSTGTITLSWGLLNMSLSIFSSTEEESFGRKEFVDGDPERPAGRATIDKTTGEVIDSSRVVRLAEADNGAWIEVTDDELASIVGTRNVAEVLTFVPLDQALTKYVPNGYMQVRPKKVKGVADPASAQAFAIFIGVMASKNLCALVRVATRGPARYGLVMPNGDFLYVHSTDSVRQPASLVLPAIDQRHLSAAMDLVDAIGVSTPELPAVTQNSFRDLVNAKAQGAIIGIPAEPAPTNVVDLFNMLSASIDQVKSQGNPWAAPDATTKVA